MNATDDVKDRLALARAWLTRCLSTDRELPFVLGGMRLAKVDERDPLTRALLRMWVEATRGVALDELGRLGSDWSPVAWLSAEAVRAVFLARRLRLRGVVL